MNSNWSKFVRRFSQKARTILVTKYHFSANQIAEKWRCYFKYNFTLLWVQSDMYWITYYILQLLIKGFSSLILTRVVQDYCASKKDSSTSYLSEGSEWIRIDSKWSRGVTQTHSESIWNHSWILKHWNSPKFLQVFYNIFNVNLRGL